MTMGELIQARRKKAGMTQAELASKANLSTMSIRRYEAGERVINESVLQRISAALDVNLFEKIKEYDKRLLLSLEHGRIVHTENTAFWRDAVGMYGSPTCSECGGSAAVKTRFCPHCGARMENFVAEKR